MSIRISTIGIFLCACLVTATGLHAQTSAPFPGTETVETGKAFDAYVEDLRAAIAGNRMGIVAQASATNGAASIGKTIAGNAVIMVFRPDFAVRMLEASVPAGIEAPLRLYVTEQADGSAMLTYREPSAVFAPYGVTKLDEMAAELDVIFEQIVNDSVK